MIHKKQKNLTKKIKIDIIPQKCAYFSKDNLQKAKKKWIYAIIPDEQIRNIEYIQDYDFVFPFYSTFYAHMNQFFPLSSGSEHRYNKYLTFIIKYLF